MARTLNKVMLIGRVGGQPEMKYTQSGKAVAQLSLATDNYEGRDEQGTPRTTTEWHNLVLWEKLAETAANYLQKGQLLYIEGRLYTSKWEDESGMKRSRTEIVVEKMIMMGSKPGDTGPLATNTDEDADEAEYPLPTSAAVSTAAPTASYNAASTNNPTRRQPAAGATPTNQPRRRPAAFVEGDEPPF